ncbi:MAG: glycosyltransferase [Melioribacteraceae bacterium]|nr:MAG: glycosyltransferase [Melioribacteraceae bacterium]
MKILFLLSRYPYPINKGDKLRAYHQINNLRNNNEVHLIAINEELNQNKYEHNLETIADFVTILKLSKLQKIWNLFRSIFSKFPFQTEYFYTKKNKMIIDSIVERYKPDIIICQLIRMGKYLESIDSVPKVIDYIDVLSKGLELRKSRVSFLLKPIFDSEYKRVLEYEEKVNSKFDGSIIITENDKNALPINNKSGVMVVPNGIETDYFQPDPELKKDIDLLFVGNMSYKPNIDAVVYFIESIFPLVKQKHPNCKFHIVGSSPSLRIKRLVNKSVIVSGWVDDIRPFYNRAKIFVAPMQIGTGLQNKILEAMSMSIPAVISSHAAKGIEGCSANTVFIEDSPMEFANRILELIENPILREKMGKESRQFVKKHYSWENIVGDFEKYLNKIANRVE